MTNVSRENHRESHIVELVDPEGVPIGSTTVGEAHRAPGRLHRAFSVFLRDAEGRVLVQQRAAAKTRFPLRWANTCCGHPAPGEELAAAASTRLAEEVGASVTGLTPVGVFSYYAEDPSTGRVEYEYDHVLVGDFAADSPVNPDPDEVAELRWMAVPDLRRALAERPLAYAPWLAGVTECLAAYLEAGSPASGTDAAERSGG